MIYKYICRGTIWGYNMKQVFIITRKLRNYESSNGRQVFIRVRMKGVPDIEIQVYDYVNNAKVPISVKIENWNKGYVTGGKYHLTVRDLNLLLKKVEDNVIDALNELIRNKIKPTRDNVFKLTYINEENALENERRIASGEIIVNEDGGAFASEDEFIEFVSESSDSKFDVLKKEMGIFKKKYILDYWDDFIENFAPNSYNCPKKSIENYIQKTGDNCEASSYGYEWLDRYFKFIVKNGFSWKKDGSESKDYTTSTIVKYHKHLRRFGDYLFVELKILNNQDYKRFTLHKKSKKQSILQYTPEPFINTHALYKKEFDYFFGFEFKNERLTLARDLFILQTWLGGLRVSDFLKLNDTNFHKDSDGNYKVWFEQQKTNDNVLNPVNQNYIIPILEKNPALLKNKYEAHHYNRLLKEAAKEAGLNRLMKFRIQRAKESQATTEWFPMHEKISNRWARNCAVSILCELGYPDDRIMKFTGHRDIKMINHYKEVHQKDVVSMIDSVKPETTKKLDG